MKFAKGLLRISLAYYLINCILAFLMFNSNGGGGLVFYLALLFLYGISLLVIIPLAVVNNKKWLNIEYGQTSEFLLLSYLIVPLITLYLLEF